MKNNPLIASNSHSDDEFTDVLGCAHINKKKRSSKELYKQTPETAYVELIKTNPPIINYSTRSSSDLTIIYKTQRWKIRVVKICNCSSCSSMLLRCKTNFYLFIFRYGTEKLEKTFNKSGLSIALNNKLAQLRSSQKKTVVAEELDELHED